MRDLPARPTSTVGPRPVRAVLREIYRLLAFAKNAKEYVEIL